MPRRRPGRLRPSANAPSHLTGTDGLAPATVEALAELDEPDLAPDLVAEALRTWRTVVHLSAAVLSAPHNDWTEFIGPSARWVLHAADRALSQAAGAPLRGKLARLDAEFARKTSQNPFADPSLPWWDRRWWH